MQELTSARWIKFKGLLFLAAGSIAAAMLLVDQPDLRTALLLAICIWSFCRFYYFAFYVIEHYVDPGFRFSGLLAFVRYMLARRGNPPDRSGNQSGHNA
ncbi:MAG: hypothetical protein ACKV0T_05140 [Planctomycetales bacterium]